MFEDEVACSRVRQWQGLLANSLDKREAVRSCIQDADARIIIPKSAYLSSLGRRGIHSPGSPLEPEMRPPPWEKACVSCHSRLATCHCHPTEPRQRPFVFWSGRSFWGLAGTRCYVRTREGWRGGLRSDKVARLREIAGGEIMQASLSWVGISVDSGETYGWS